MHARVAAARKEAWCSLHIRSVYSSPRGEQSQFRSAEQVSVSVGVRTCHVWTLAPPPVQISENGSYCFTAEAPVFVGGGYFDRGGMEIIDPATFDCWGWRIFRWRGEVEEVLRKAMRTGGDVRKQAAQLVNHLGRRGGTRTSVSRSTSCGGRGSHSPTAPVHAVRLRRRL